MAMAKVIVLKSLQGLMYIVNILISATLGYSFAFGWKEEKLKASTNYQSSAQILKISFRAKYVDPRPSSLEQYLLFHSEYVHPNVVCHDNITLLTVTPEQACFAVLPPEVDVYSSEVSPFFYVTQFRFATHIVVMPIRSFHRLAEEIGDPRAQTVLVWHTGRCGSTILAQMFEAIPNTIVIAEPDALLQPLLDCCKYIKHVYMYRHPKQTICSYLSIFHGQPFALGLWKFYMSIPDTSEYQSINIDQILKGLSVCGFTTLAWVFNIACYIESKHEGIDIYPIKYEDLLKHPESTTSEMFAFLDIPKQYTSRAVTALEKDSHRGSHIAREKLSKTKMREFNTQQLTEVNFVLQKSGFPAIEEFQDLPDKRQLELKSFLTSYS